MFFSALPFCSHSKVHRWSDTQTEQPMLIVFFSFYRETKKMGRLLYPSPKLVLRTYLAVPLEDAGWKGSNNWTFLPNQPINQLVPTRELSWIRGEKIRSMSKCLLDILVVCGGNLFWFWYGGTFAHESLICSWKWYVPHRFPMSLRIRPLVQESMWDSWMPSGRACDYIFSLSQISMDVNNLDSECPRTKGHSQIACGGHPFSGFSLIKYQLQN